MFVRIQDRKYIATWIVYRVKLSALHAVQHGSSSHAEPKCCLPEWLAVRTPFLSSWEVFENKVLSVLSRL